MTPCKQFEEAISKDPALRGLEESLQKVLEEKILKKEKKEVDVKEGVCDEHFSTYP